MKTRTKVSPETKTYASLMERKIVFDGVDERKKFSSSKMSLKCVRRVHRRSNCLLPTFSSLKTESSLMFMKTHTC